MAKNQLEQLKDRLNRNGFQTQLCGSAEEARDKALAIIGTKSVGFGSSMTVNQLGIYDALSAKGNQVYWHWKSEATDALFRAAANAEVYLCSVNAVTEAGDLINIDKTGNRVANTFYGPKEVVLIVGRNKLCKDIAAGIDRIKNVVCPLNTARLNAKTPCRLTGKCADCNSPERICRTIVILQRPSAAVEHVHVLLVDEDLGY